MPGYGGVFLGTGGRVIFFGVAANLTNISVNTQGVGVERLYQCSIMARFHGLWSLAGFFGALLGAAMVDWHISAETHFIAIFLICMIILAVFPPLFCRGMPGVPPPREAACSGAWMLMYWSSG